MRFQQFESFDALAKEVLKPEQIIASAWPDIQRAFQKPEGLKKQRTAEEAQIAFERAVETLRTKYTSPSAFRNDVAQFADNSVPGVTKQALYQFAGRWEQYEKQQSTIDSHRNAATWETAEVLAYRMGSNRDRAPLTQNEWEDLRQRKK